MSALSQLQSTIRTKVDLLEPGSAPPLKVEAFGLTNRGRVRPSNEDNFLIAELAKALCMRQSSLPDTKTHYSHEHGHLFLVADGMGGHAAGERARALAVKTIEDFVLNTFKWFFDLRGPEGDTVVSEFQGALRQADACVFDEVSRHPELTGMGTTLTMAYHLGAALFIVHVGDSRCYLWRNGKLYQLTKDHTLVAEWERQGILSPEQAAQHRMRHVIVNVVGGRDPGVQVEAHKVGLEPGDEILLCSDGLTEMLSDEEMVGILNEAADARSACERLVAGANTRGGKDNITVIVARFSGE